ncbi:sulfotransferase family protein [Dietzia sp. WMMA184]|uniref:sulfotransferase family protein n=1 Tax=Dietzia sp. WMMA184 TaxID=2039808 RepID=UPI001C1FCC8F|nr:sulfotransferase family protein [Dietzia sp. WMMA184]
MHPDPIAHLRGIIPDIELSLHPLISMRHKYVFFPISKNANWTLKTIFRSVEMEAIGPGYKVESAHQLFNPPLISPYQVGEEFYANEVLQSYYKFTFVRNPYTRLLSCYLDRIHGNPRSVPRRRFNTVSGFSSNDEVTFSDFVQIISSQKSIDMNDHWRDQYSNLLAGNVSFDFIGRFENMREDLEHVFKARIPDSDLYRRLERQNNSPQVTSAGSLLSKYYSDELVEIVSERYRMDFETFGYSTDLESA